MVIVTFTPGLLARHDVRLFPTAHRTTVTFDAPYTDCERRALLP